MNVRSPLTLATVLLLASGVAVQAQDLQPLREALTLHASFEDGMNADFSKGDRIGHVLKKGALVPAEANDDVQISERTGRYGNALRFVKKSGYRPLFSGTNVLNYSPDAWNTSVSVWLKLNPDVDLEPGYCDPVQIVGGDAKKGFVFLEWSKDETPRFFRYAIRPLFEIWNPDNLKWDEIPVNKRPMVQVSKAPFSADQWTHVVFTIENANNKSGPQRGKLFMNGKFTGAIENWDLTFGWEPGNLQLVLGAAYVGQMDDLAVFNRALTDVEVQQVYQLKTGVRELHSQSDAP